MGCLPHQVVVVVLVSIMGWLPHQVVVVVVVSGEVLVGVSLVRVEEGVSLVRTHEHI